jgi:hypothetical protein
MAGSPKLSPRKNRRKSETKPSRNATSQRDKGGRRGDFEVGGEAVLVFTTIFVVDDYIFGSRPKITRRPQTGKLIITGGTLMKQMAADALRYLVATKARSVVPRKLRGL